MSVPTKPAALLSRGDVVGYEGHWRRVRSLRTETGRCGPSVIVAWEEGGFDRFHAEDELLLGTPRPPTP
ncbi:hypothetical protein [Streptomyces sp. NPDC091268]|uniref:hypothetical protein n=1 Tax=Streptomyces sp. NPDC091268 TaxID=3365979 RepID=UPI00382FC9B9